MVVYVAFCKYYKRRCRSCKVIFEVVFTSCIWRMSLSYIGISVKLNRWLPGYVYVCWHVTGFYFFKYDFLQSNNILKSLDISCRYVFYIYYALPSTSVFYATFYVSVVFIHILSRRGWVRKLVTNLIPVMSCSNECKFFFNCFAILYLWIFHNCIIFDKPRGVPPSPFSVIGLRYCANSC